MTVQDEGTGPDRRTRVQGEPVPFCPPVVPEAERGAVRRITVVGEEILHRPCREVTEDAFGTAGLAALVDDMFATNQAADGAGLAANQVGVDLRLFVWDITDDWGYGTSATSPTRYSTTSPPPTAAWWRNPRAACRSPAPTVSSPARTAPSSGAATRTVGPW